MIGPWVPTQFVASLERRTVLLPFAYVPIIYGKTRSNLIGEMNIASMRTNSGRGIKAASTHTITTGAIMLGKDQVQTRRLQGYKTEDTNDGGAKTGMGHT